MGNKLDDELDQILKNTAIESNDNLDELKSVSKLSNYIPKVTFKYLMPVICLLLSFFILQIFIPANFINKVIFWGILIVFIILFSVYLLDSRSSEYQPKWRGKPVENLQKKGIVSRLRKIFKE
jgi:hypothetical protein